MHKLQINSFTNTNLFVIWSSKVEKLLQKIQRERKWGIWHLKMNKFFGWNGATWRQGLGHVRIFLYQNTQNKTLKTLKTPLACTVTQITSCKASNTDITHAQLCVQLGLKIHAGMKCILILMGYQFFLNWIICLEPAKKRSKYMSHK